MAETKEKEIDIRDVFAAIGRFFTRIFNGIGNSFVSTIFYVKKNKKLVSALCIAGFVAGLMFSLLEKSYYQSTMVIRSNDYYLDKNLLEKISMELTTMCKVEDYEGLAQTLNISPEDAAMLKGFELEKDEDVTNIGLYYSKYFRILSNIPDQAQREEMLQTFMENEKEYVYHIIAKAYDASVLPRLNEPFANLINNNPFFVKRKEIEIKALELSGQKITEELKKLDSLKITFTNALKESSKNMERGGSNNIFMGDAKLYNPLPVYDKYIELHSRLVSIGKEMRQKEKSAEMVSGFVKIEKDKKIPAVFSGIIGGIAGFIMGILIALALSFVNYANRLQPVKNNL